MQCQDHGAGDVLYTCLPLYHTAGGGLGAMSCFMSGPMMRRSLMLTMLKMLKTNMYQDSHTQRYSRQMWMSCWVLCFCSNSDTLGHPDRIDEGDIHTVTTYSHLSTYFTYFTFFRCLICINCLNIPEDTRIYSFYKVSVGDFCGIRDQPDQPWTFHICR